MASSRSRSRESACLATLAAAAPTAGGRQHEIKFDGYRLQARFNRDGVKLLTRSGLDWTDRFAPIVAPLRGLRPESLAA